MKLVADKKVIAVYCFALIVVIASCFFLFSTIGSNTPKALELVNIFSLLIVLFITVCSLIFYRQYIKIKRKENEAALQGFGKATMEINNLNAGNDKMNDIQTRQKFESTGRLARMIAHEIRNPLTNIGLANDQLKDAVENNEENTMLIGMIKRNSERINALISELLNATKYIDLLKSPVAINTLLDEVLLASKEKMAINNIRLQKSYADGVSKVMVDEDKIVEALLIIISNAIEAAGEAGGGIIQVATSNTGGQCRIVIKDNGPGMNEDTVTKLFEPFFTKKNNSNGLGLTMVQNIILNHDGSINVQSKPGKGTSFIINLPCA